LDEEKKIPIVISKLIPYFCGSKSERKAIMAENHFVKNQDYLYSMNYYKVSITSTAEMRDVIIAILSQSNYDGFEENDFGFKTFIGEAAFDETVISNLADQFNFSYKVKLIPQQNWNTIWESNFQPIQIKDFCGIRADFHPNFTEVKHEITINPKMAFGTGHHETTMSMIEVMQALDFQDKKVLDYGCGTGILAILAALMGANSVLAIDYDPLSYENTLENCKKNNIEQVEARLGELSTINDDEFDLILANINRNVILNSLPSLFLKTKESGQVLISGFLDSDMALMTNTVEKIGFTVKRVLSKGEWICLQLAK